MQSAGVPFPTTAWPTGQLPAGVSRVALDEAVDEAFGFRYNPATVRSIVVIHGGKLVFERYKGSDDETTTYASFSVAKSVTNAMIGLLVGDGRLDPLGPAPVRQWSSPGDQRAAATINDLLHMAGGQRWDESYTDGAGSVFGLLLADNGPAYAANQPFETTPGVRFEYSTGTSALLAGIASDAVGGPDDGVNYLTERLLKPLGMTSTNLNRDPSGYYRGGLGADSTTRDFAKFGLLYLRDGVWDGKRLLPAGWVDYSRSPGVSPQYGAHWWVNSSQGMFWAAGLFGQRIVVVPKFDLVFAINTYAGGSVGPLVDAVYDAFDAAL